MRESGEGERGREVAREREWYEKRSRGCFLERIICQKMGNGQRESEF